MAIFQLCEQPPLIKAIFAGDLEGTKELLNNKTDANIHDAEKRTPLHAAAFKGDAGIAEALLESGARINAKDAKWVTPLHHACSVNAEKVVALLLDSNADISARDRFWQTPLHVAAANNAYESLELLLDHVPNLNVTDRSGKTALHHAAHNGYYFIADQLISRGCAVNASDKKYYRPLHCAAQMGHVDTIDLLIKCGADVNASDWNQYTPLHVAAANGNDSVCRRLINAGANVDAQNTYGNTPLHIACLNGQQLVCQDLVSSGADPEAVNFRGQTPVHIAAASAHGAECMMFLLSQKVDVNKRSMDGRTPLHMTAIHGRFTRSKSLIDQGAIIDCTDKNGCTPLHIAAQYGHDLLANTLMCYGANPSFKGHEGRTPLHMCCLSGFVECCRKFLLVGVDLNAVDDSGKTPVHCAAYKGSVECLDLLVSNGAEFLGRDKIGRTPLHYSASQGHYQCVFTLVGIGSPTNSEDDQGCTPLHLAAGYDREGKCVEYMLQHSADPLKRDKRGFTSLHYAAAGNNTNAFEILLRASKNANLSEESSETLVTPLHLAAKLGNDDIVRALLNHNVDVNAQDNQGTTALMLASREGHVQCVQSLMKAGASVIICDKTNKMTAVHHSAKNGHHECLLEMFKKEDGRESVNMMDSLQRTPLMLAVSSNHIECVRAILEHSADVEKVVNMVDGDSHSSLFRAVVFGQSKIVQLLLSKNATANLADVNGKRVIHLAAACGHLACLQILMDFLAPEDITVMDSQECTALHWACYRGNTSCVELLLQKDLFKTLDGNKFSPVHCASFSGSVQCLQLLVNYYGKEIVHLQDSRKRFPLHICALHGHSEAAKFLLEQGAEIDVLDEEERTPFIAAAQFGQNQIIELLLTYKVNKTYQDKYGNTALHWACLMKHNLTAVLLLKDLDDSNVIHCTNKEGKTALHLAARNGLVDVTGELLKKGASVFAIDSEGYTPALCCAPNNQVAQCLALILLNLKDERFNDIDPKQTLNSFLQNANENSPNLPSQSAPKKSVPTQTNPSAKTTSERGQALGACSKKTSWSTASDSSSTLFQASWKRDRVTGREVYESEADCFLIEQHDFGGSGIGKYEVQANMGLDLHRSFSAVSISKNIDNKLDLEGTLRIQNLKELSDRKTTCKECTLWQRRCSDCTIRYILRQHMQGKTSPKEFNEFLLKTLNETSPEYRYKLLHVLEEIEKEYLNRRSKDGVMDIRRVVRMEKTKQFFGKNRSLSVGRLINKPKIKPDGGNLTSSSEWHRRHPSLIPSGYGPLTNKLFMSGSSRSVSSILPEELRLMGRVPKYVEFDRITMKKRSLKRYKNDFDRKFNIKMGSEKNHIEEVKKTECCKIIQDDNKSDDTHITENDAKENCLDIKDNPATLSNANSDCGGKYENELINVSNVTTVSKSEEHCDQADSVIEEVDSGSIAQPNNLLVEEYLLPPKNLSSDNDTLASCLDIIPVTLFTEEDVDEIKTSEIDMITKDDSTRTDPEDPIAENELLDMPLSPEKDPRKSDGRFSVTKTKMKQRKDFSCSLF